MLKAFATPGDRSRTLFLLAVSAALAVGAAGVGIDDNPPGLALALASAATLVAAFAHPWRSPRSFRRLIYGSVAAFVASALLHNLFAALAAVPDLPQLAERAFTVFAVAFFFVALLLCPAAFVVGLLGAAVTRLRSPAPG